MSDVGPELSKREMADLCALADGSLPAARRAEIEARIAASPELQQLLERQRLSLRATQALAAEPVPDSLRTAVEAAAATRRRPRRADEGRRTAGPSSKRRSRVALGLSAAAAVAAVAIVVIVSTVGGPSAPSVAGAARLALQAPVSPAPAVAASGNVLTAGVDGVSFPNLARTFGWQATGVRTGQVAGRDATVVYYEKNGQRIGYGIVSGPALERPSAQSTTLDGVEYQTLTVNGNTAVTWREGGHTCVLIGRAPPSQLLALASWSSDTETRSY